MHLPRVEKAETKLSLAAHQPNRRAGVDAAPAVSTPPVLGRLRVEQCAQIKARSDLLRSAQGGFGHTDRPAADLLVTWRDGRRTTVKVPLLTTAQKLGGLRRWFGCPSCGRRAGCLYSLSSDQPFACRVCWGPVYEAQYLSPENAAIRAALKRHGLP
jgi:hypothetical protein